MVVGSHGSPALLVPLDHRVLQMTPPRLAVLLGSWSLLSCGLRCDAALPRGADITGGFHWPAYALRRATLHLSCLAAALLLCAVTGLHHRIHEGFEFFLCL